MYNSSSHPQPSSSPPPSMSPRISFSNDFVVESQKPNSSTKAAPPSTDFEFSISNNDLIISADADDLFFKGRLLPFKPNSTRTLRDQLLLLDDDADDHRDDHGDHNLDQLFLKPSNNKDSSSNRWKGFLGLRKSHIVGSKIDDKIDSEISFANQGPNLTKSSKVSF